MDLLLADSLHVAQLIDKFRFPEKCVGDYGNVLDVK